MGPITFRRWRNKGYAVFASLHRIIRIGTLSAAYTLITLPVSVAQGDTAFIQKRIELGEVELIEESSPDILAAGAAPIILIRQDELSHAGSQGLNALLENYSLLDIRERGAFGIQADLSIRGSSFDQVLVLVNGINLTDPQTGHFNLNLPFDPGVIDHIEILKGPAATFYGASGYAGAVNIVTRPDTSHTLTASAVYGSFRRMEGSATVNINHSGSALLAHLSAGSSAGYRENTDYRNGNLYLHARHSGKLLTGELMTGLNARAFGANSFYSLRFPEQYEETTTGFAAFKLSGRSSGLPLRLSGGLRLNRDHFLLRRYDPAFYRNEHRTLVSYLDLTGGFESHAGYTRLGLGLRNESIISTVLGEALETPIAVSGNDSLWYLNADNRTEYRLTINQKKTTGRLTLAAGLYAYLNGLASGDPFLFPGAELSWQMNTHWSVFSSMNRSMRLPTFTDLYYKGPQNEGNSGLKPEHAWTGETGLNGEYKNLSLGLALFLRDGRETIDWVWMEDEKWHTMNYTRLISYGGELSFTLSPDPLYRIDKLGLSYAFTTVAKVPGEYDSYYALDFLKHQARFIAVLHPIQKLRITINSRFQERNGSYVSYDPISSLSEAVDYGAFIVSDLRLAYELKTFQLFAECANLFATQYMDFGGLPQPGRSFNFGLRFN